MTCFWGCELKKNEISELQIFLYDVVENLEFFHLSQTGVDLHVSLARRSCFPLRSPFVLFLVILTKRERRFLISAVFKEVV
jgi:hypothetical protein